jgi:hypothetical protein
MVLEDRGCKKYYEMDKLSSTLFFFILFLYFSLFFSLHMFFVYQLAMIRYFKKNLVVIKIERIPIINNKKKLILM